MNLEDIKKVSVIGGMITESHPEYFFRKEHHS